MKKTLYSVLALSAIFAFTSCDQSRLDIPQKGVTLIEDFYQTDEDAEAALVAAYTQFATFVAGRGDAFIYTPIKMSLNNGGDDMYAAGSNYGDNSYSSDLNDYNYDSGCEVIKNFYGGIFQSVYAANLVIEKFAEGTTEIQKRCVAEARTLRAYDYFLLAALWGTPPLVTKVITLRDLPTNCDLDPDYKYSNKDLMLWVAAEAEAAAAVLPERESKADKNGAVKCTKGFAQAVAGKAYIFAGEYAKAKTVLQKVIDSQKYDLVAKFEDNFHTEGDGNAEKVFEANIEFNAGLGAWSGINQRSTWMEADIWNWRTDHFVDGAVPQAVYSGGADGWGGLGVPQWFGDEFFANEGHSQRFDATFIRVDDAIYNMTYSNDALNNMTLDEKKASNKVGIKDVSWGLYGQSYWLPKKQLLKATDLASYGNNVRMNNNIIMRYAEVLLLYAEACLQTNDAANAKIAINAIQTRAGAPVSATVDMDVLKKEKSYELWLEGCRMLDIKRWGDTERIKNAGQGAPRLFDKLYREPKATDEAVTWLPGEDATTGRFYTVMTHNAREVWGDKVGYKEGKNEYFPYPIDAINKNPNLKQNPGY